MANELSYKGVRGGAGGNKMKLVQSGSSSLGSGSIKDIVITSVVTANSFVIVTVPVVDFDTQGADHIIVTGRLTSSTNLRLQRGNTGSSTQTAKWQVVEFENLKSMQTGETVMTVRNVNVGISNIDRTKSFLIVSARTTQSVTGSPGYLKYGGYISSDTNVSISQYSSVSTGMTMRWFAIEFD